MAEIDTSFLVSISDEELIAVRDYINKRLQKQDDIHNLSVCTRHTVNIIMAFTLPINRSNIFYQPIS